MNKKFHKIMSFILVICMLLTLIPTSIFTNIKAESTADVNNDNWEVGLKLYDITSGETQVNNIIWDSTTAEEKTFKVVISYKNTISQKAYAPGSIQIEVDSILDNIRDCHDIVINSNFGGNTPQGYDIVYFIDADKASSTNKTNQWSYSVESTGKSYYNVPTKFIITNNETLEAQTSYQGTIAITFTLNSNTVKSPSAGTYGAVFKTSDGTKLTTNTFDFNFTSTKKPYSLNIEAEKLKSSSGLREDANDYVWAKYSIDYNILSSSGVREAFGKTLKISIPEGAIMYDSSYAQISKSSDGTYDLGAYIEKLNIKTLLENNVVSNAKTFVVAFPKDIYSTTLDITAYLYGTYRDENSSVLLTEKSDTRVASQFELDYDGELYWIGKTIMSPNISYEGISTTGANAKWKLYYGAKYSNEVGSINMICGDDILYAQNQNGEWYQLSDEEYQFVDFDATYINNQSYYGLRNMSTGADVSDKYEVEIYVRYKGSSSYNLWKQGKLNASDMGSKLTFPANVVGVQFKILNSNNEDIELYGDLEIKFTSTTMASDSDIYNFNYLEIEKIDGTPVDLEITEDNYITAPTKTYIMTYDQNKYGHLMFRGTDYTTAGDAKVFLSAWKDLDSTSITVDSNKETINFNYKMEIGLAVRYIYSTTNEFIGYTLYDLLPEGIELNATESQIKSAFASAQNVDVFNNKSNTYSQFSDGTHRNWWLNHTNVEIIENYQDTGRTLLKIQLDCKDDPLDLTHTYDYYYPQYGHLTNSYAIAMLKFNIGIPCKISFDDWYELGTTYTNYLYITDSNESKGYTTILNSFTPTRTESTMSTVSDTGYFDEVLNDIDGDGITDENIGFSKITKTLAAAMNTYTDLTKTISADGENWSKGTVKVGYDRNYSYKLRARIGVDNIANDLKIFDSIERVSQGWKGTLTGFDTSWAENKGYTVKIYYATNDLSDSEAYTTDLTNSMWQEYNSTVDLKTIKHVAFTFYNADGTLAEFEAGDVMYVQINMKSPKTTRIDDTNTEVNELQTANNARFTINSLSTTGVLIEEVDLPSNTVYAVLPEVNISVLKAVPSINDNYDIMGIDPYEEHAFPIKFIDKETGAIVLNSQIYGFINSSGQVSSKGIKIRGLEIGKTYIIKEDLPADSLFVFNSISKQSSHSAVSLTKVNNEYEFIITDAINDLPSNVNPNVNLIVYNNINLKTINLQITKEVIATDRAYDYYGYTRTMPFDIKLTNKEDSSDFKRISVSANGTVTINNILPGTYILEETNLPEGWTLQNITALNSITGVSISLVNGKYELTIGNTIVNNSTYEVKITNKLTKPTEINLEIQKEVSGTDKAFEQLDFNKTDVFSFNIKLTNKINASAIKTGTVTTNGNLIIENISAGTWIIEETDLEEYWILQEIISLNTVQGISLNKVGEDYELTISESAPDNSTFQIKIINELQETGDPFIKVIFKKTINGTVESFKNLNLDPNGEYDFQMNLINSDYKVHGIVTNKEDLIIMQVPIGTYTVTESKDPCFNFVSMQALNSVAGITFTQENGNYILNVTEDITGNEAITIEVINQTAPDTYYNGKDDKFNLFKLESEPYAIFSEDDNSLTFIRSIEEPIVGETYKGKTISVVYTGFEENAYEETEVPWHDKKEVIETVDFIHEIKPISTAYWFSNMVKCITINCKNLNTEEVTDMSAMFSGCKLLEVADVSRFNTSKVTSLYDMFYNCRKLNRINVSNWDTSNVTTMEFTFQNCYAIQSLDLSNWNTSKVENMGYMFYYCENLLNLDLSNFDTSKVQNMQYMFYSCEKLQEIVLSSFDTSNVTNMYYMFAYCSNLESLNLSSFNTKKVTNLKYMFTRLNNLSEITIGANFSLEGDGQTTDTTTFPISAGVTCDGDWYRVPDQQKFTAAELPDETAATYIGSNPDYFKITEKNYFMTGLPESGEIIIPESFVYDGQLYNVYAIGNGFRYKNITKITIPETIVKIDDHALYCNNVIESIIVDEDHPTLKDIDGVLFSKSGKTLIQYPASKPETTYTIPDTVEVIGQSSFINNKYLETVTLSANTKEIKNSAFYESKNLTQINLGNVQNIGAYAFYKCEQLTTIIFPATMRDIGGAAFAYCTGLISVRLPYHLSSGVLNSAIFEKCENLKSVSLPYNLAKISDYAFSTCRALTSISIPIGVTEIGRAAFAYTTANISLPSTVRIIREWAFHMNTQGVLSFNASNLIILEDNAFYYTAKISADRKTMHDLNPNAVSKNYLYDVRMYAANLITYIEQPYNS